MTTPLPKAAIVGIAGPTLADDETALLRAYPPAGVVLFGRNVQDPGQLRGLTDALRAVLPEDAVLMVDQEGGRVARLKPPHWRGHPAAGAIGDLFAADPAGGLRAAWVTGALIGLQCREAGFDVVCAPVLDRRIAGAHDVIGDRAYAADPPDVAALAAAAAAGLLAAGVQPVGKHAPGHGHARADSHLSLPEVETVEDDDILPFARNATLPWMMTAHIRYLALDAVHPATLSARILAEVVRGRIGFQGVLVSDDLAMQALSGSPVERALGCLAAGCDIALYCPGDADGTAAVLEQVPVLGQAGRERMAAGRALARQRRQELDPMALAHEQDGLLG